MESGKWESRIVFCICALGAFVIGMLVNFIIAIAFLTKAGNFENSMTGIGKHMSPVATPLVLKTGGRGSEQKNINEFLKEVGLPSDADPGCANEHLVEFDYVTRLNPYPQPLEAIHSPHPHYVDYLSFGYLGTDQRYHQITHYWGESDTTPSFLIPKVRGLETGYGDYYVCYTMCLTKDLKPRPRIINSRTGDVLEYEPPQKRPDIDRIDWRSTGDGFEEWGFAFYATLIEGLLIVAVLVLRRHIAKSKSPQTPNNEQPATSI